MASSVRTVAGSSAKAGYKDGDSEIARFSTPGGVAVNGDGTTVFVADTDNHCIRTFDIKSEMTATLTGSADGVSGHEDGSLAESLFNGPCGLAWSAKTNALFIAERDNCTIRKIVNGQVSTVAGQAGVSGFLDNEFRNPTGVHVDPTGTVWIADTNNHEVRYILPGKKVESLHIKTWLTKAINTDLKALGSKSAGHQTTKNFKVDGVKHSIQAGAGADWNIDLPGAVVVDPINKKVYVSCGYRILRIIAKTGFVDLQIGTGNHGCKDGKANEAQFEISKGMCLGYDGAIYVCDTGNHLLRRIDPIDGSVKTVAGSVDKASAFFNPTGIASDGVNQCFWVVDAHRLHKVTLGPNDKFIPAKPSAVDTTAAAADTKTDSKSKAGAADSKKTPEPAASASGGGGAGTGAVADTKSGDTKSTPQPSETTAASGSGSGGGGGKKSKNKSAAATTAAAATAVPAPAAAEAPEPPKPAGAPAVQPTPASSSGGGGNKKGKNKKGGGGGGGGGSAKAAAETENEAPAAATGGAASTTTSSSTGSGSKLPLFAAVIVAIVAVIAIVLSQRK